MAGDYVEAEKAYREAIRLKPSAEAYANLGFALSKQGKHAEAVKELQTAIRLDKEYPKSYFFLGYAYGEQEIWKEAEKAYCEAIRLKENYAEAYHNLGVVLGEQGRHEKAAQALCQARLLNPNDSLALYNLGIEYVLLDNLDMAEASFREDIRQHPMTVMGRYYLHYILQKKKKKTEADQLYRELQDLPDYAKGFESLAKFLDKHGKREEARVRWELALTKEKRPEWLERIKKRLAEQA
jgi:Flp pilus assembly protein TadD